MRIAGGKRFALQKCVHNSFHNNSSVEFPYIFATYPTMSHVFHQCNCLNRRSTYKLYHGTPVHNLPACCAAAAAVAAAAAAAVAYETAVAHTLCFRFYQVFTRGWNV